MLQVGTHFIISNLSCCFIVLGFYYAEAIDQICMHIYIALICTKQKFLGMFKMDPFVRLISIDDMGTLIWTDYEAWVRFGCF